MHYDNDEDREAELMASVIGSRINRGPKGH
jgi:hypothetical protein